MNDFHSNDIEFTFELLIAVSQIVLFNTARFLFRI